MIVATAGHVDHGKTSLVRALTGVDTDRLPEEKKRGMTIDLGFAYAGPLGFVDVPGHERFVHNMLAGVGGVDFVLFVVAADDGPMPQTREHLAILDLLGVARGAVALTKIDRVAPERVAEVRTEIIALLAPTLLAGMPVFPVSSVTGHGIDVLKQHLLQQQTETALRSTEGHFRLSVDRAFTIAGAGLVVTGTALSGEVAVGDEVRALLAGKTARVRGIHAQNAPAPRGRAGERLALNLAGLDAGAVARGDWIVRGELPPPVSRIDARLRVTDAKPLAHWTPVHVHLGAADVLGRVALLDDTGLVQLVLERPIGALRGDRFIVRDQSARRTLGGGMVIDVFPPPRGRARPERLAWLRTMEAGNDREALERLLRENPLGIDLSRFLANRNLKTLAEVPMRAAGGIGFSPEHWKALRERALATIGAFHARSPESGSLPEDRIVEGTRLPRKTLVELGEELAREAAIVRDGAGVRLAGHRAQLNATDAALWERVAPILAEGSLRPPTLTELAAALGKDAKHLEPVLARLARHGLLVRVSKNRFFTPQAVKRLEEIAQAEAKERGTITAAAFRDRAGIGRNLTIEVLEYFDRTKFTRRAGDAHVLVR